MAVWATWMAGSTVELALEQAVDGALTGAGWTLELPGLGHFSVVLESRRGSTCRCELLALSVDMPAMAAVGTRH